MCLYLYIHNKYTQYTLNYYVHKTFVLDGHIMDIYIYIYINIYIYIMDIYNLIIKITIIIIIIIPLYKIPKMLYF